MAEGGIGSDMEDSDLFTLFIHHGGYFDKHEGVDAYFKGFFVGIYDLKRRSFNLENLHVLVKALGYASWDKLYYRRPRSNIFMWIKGDEEVVSMMHILSDFEISVLYVYVDGGVDDKSGRLETNMCYTPTFGTFSENEVNEINEVNEVNQVNEMYVADVGGIDRADVDGVVNEVNQVNEMYVADVGGIDRADVDGLVTQLDVEQGRDERVEHWGLEHWDEDEENDADYVCDEDEHESDDDLGEGDADFSEGESDEEYREARRNLRETKDEELNRLLREYMPPEVNVKEEPVEEYIDSDEDFHSGDSDSDDGLISRRNKVVYDPKCDHKTLELVIGMRFQDGWECRRALTTYSIENGKFVRFRKVSAKMCEAKCSPPCPWKVYASFRKKNHTFCIKTYKGDHNCPRSMNNKLLTSKWIAMKYLNVFRTRQWTVDDLRKDIVDRYGYDIPKDRLYNARSLANQWVRGSVTHHYALIRRYVAELRRVDREGRFELLLGDDHVFKAMYLGFSSLVKGFKQSCRPIIGLDGCHLKTFLGGILLCAVAKDGNDHMFPIAWAVVEVENEDCWGWFMKCLIADIGIEDGGNGYTFISDQQKGLENAVKSLTPFAEHRNCARHVWMNWKKKHPGQTLKNLFMQIVKSTHPDQYRVSLEALKQESVEAYQDFINRDTHKFCKAFFSTSCKSDAYTNNISETFNGYILKARGKHVIHMCEEIRSDLMSRQVKLKDAMSRVNDRICPNIRKKLEESRVESGNCYAKAALNDKFEVYHGAHQYSVSLQMNTCTCREWELCGIPCVHAIAAYSYKGQDAALFVDECYTVNRYMLAYEQGLEPLNGENMWPIVEGFIVKPPRVKKMAGRPKKKRIRSAGEEVNPKNKTKMSLKGMPMSCSNCGGANHNSRTCKNPRVERPEGPKRKRGRPAKEKTPATEGESSRNGATREGAGRGGARGRGAGLAGRGIHTARGRGGAASWFNASGGAAARGGTAARGRAARGGTAARGRAARGGAFGSAAHIAAERNFAARGAGVFIGQTGNIYYHPPNSSVTHTSASTTMQRDPSTQESRNST